MKVLLDTNIIIHREASAVFNEDIGTLFGWLDKLHYEKCIHQLTIDEIEKHEDKKVVETFKVKLNNYVLLKTEAPLAPSVQKVSKAQDKTPNDFNDTRLINELANNRVDYLISDDKGIHEKAHILDMDSRVFTIDSFLEKVTTENPDLVNYKTLSVKISYFGDVNLKDIFFDSFREDYNGFDDWFNKKSNDIAYVCLDSDNTLAFLYLKRENEDENYMDITPIFPKKKRLKIGTFKVNLNGFKLGERFLKIVFDNALKQNIDEIYVTLFNKRPEHQRLINLFLEYGFKYWGKKNTPSGEEIVYVRSFVKSVDISNPKFTFPHISLKSDVFMVSIRPEYHTNLFPDSILRTESPQEFEKNETFRNALSKVFVSRSWERNLKSGDIIVFYRTGGIFQGVVTTIGIVESVVTNIKDEKTFINLCKKRSVFSNQELSKQWNYSNSKPFVVNFLYAYSFPHRINGKTLLDLGIIKDVESFPQGFKQISRDDFEKILSNTNTDNNIIVR
ncbi:MAG: hypothetical protein IH934_01680 [Nanoarchaeota archaeon]|nr:hypothetical protein [Nanoarchaeota archaeon]